ncbi:MAG: GNAT family N-acetyltransferase [Thermodesulfobacteriota bacterium]
MKRTSTITVPNDPGYISVVQSYCEALARKAGFTEKETGEVMTALKEAFKNVLFHAFDPCEEESFTITFDLERDGLRITIDEMGMPFSSDLDDGGRSSHGIRIMKENMDSVVFTNRGRDGKELMLFKYRKGRHIEEFFPPEDLTAYDYCDMPARCDIPSRDLDYELRLMDLDEATQVSRCIYRAYRYTYLNEDLYFPERIVATNREGRMISAVAVTGGGDGRGEVIAHFAIKPRPGRRVGEIGVAVVLPNYRGRGLMKSLLDYLLKVADERGFLALYGNAFTMHNLSQKTNLKFGFSETALQLGGIPPSSVQPLCEMNLKGAGSVMTFFKYLRGAERYRVFVPARHKAMLDEIYSGIGVDRAFSEPSTRPAALPEQSSLALKIKPFHKTAVISVKTIGADLDRRVRAKRMELADKGFNTIYLDLPLTDPAAPEGTGMAEAVGFFFSGLLPDYCRGDVLRLQYCISEVFYEEIQAWSPFARELKAYVRSLDPKWKALH